MSVRDLRDLIYFPVVDPTGQFTRIYGTTIKTGSGAPPAGTPGPGGAAVTCTFVAVPLVITNGQTSTLTWTTANTVSATINNALVVLPSGAESVTPTQTTNYLFTATGVLNDVVTISQTVTVTANIVNNYSFTPDGNGGWSLLFTVGANGQATTPLKAASWTGVVSGTFQIFNSVNTVSQSQVWQGVTATTTLSGGVLVQVLTGTFTGINPPSPIGPQQGSALLNTMNGVYTVQATTVTAQGFLIHVIWNSVGTPSVLQN